MSKQIIFLSVMLCLKTFQSRDYCQLEVGFLFILAKTVFE